MPSLTTLPTELKRHIANMVAAQDTSLKERYRAAEYAQLKIDGSTPWHGRGSNALFHVSKEWSSLAAPVLFKTVWASKTFHPVFRHLVARHHAPHIHRLILDEDHQETDEAEAQADPSGFHKYLPYITLIAPLAFPNLKSISLESQVTTSLMQSIQGTTCAEPGDDGLTLAAFKDVVRPLTELKISEGAEALQAYNDTLQICLPLFPNLTSLSFDASMIWSDYELETTQAIDGLVHLDRLKITNHLSNISLDLEWSAWSPNVRSVDISSEEIYPEAWAVIGILGRNAQELVIRAQYIEDNFVPPSRPFPHLSHLIVHVEADAAPYRRELPDTRDLINPILRGISPAPLLRTIDIHSTSLPPKLHTTSSSNAKITAFTTQAVRSDNGGGRGPQPPSDDASVKLARVLGPIWGWKGVPVLSSAVETPRWESTSASGILHQALAVAERHRATGDEVGSGMLMQALSGLRSFLALEED